MTTVDVPDPPARDVGLCLSGGGYRATVFHVGALVRLNEAGLLPRLRMVSSVSGGSITAGWLGLRWKALQFDEHGVATNFREEIVDPLMRFAGRGMDVWAVLSGAFIPGLISRRVQRIYRRRLFGAATLGDLPARGEGPEFVITATNLGTGALWRFSRQGVGDFLDPAIKKLGLATERDAGFFQAPTMPLGLAVTASSAFPPVLSPCIVKASKWSDSGGAQRTVRLTDGGVYDNLGLEPLDDKDCKIVLCSDGGAPFKRKARPPRTFLRGTIHVLKVVDLQVRKLRKDDLVAGAIRGDRTVGFWAIDGDPADYVPRGAGPRGEAGEGGKPPFDLLPVSEEARREMYGISTRLAKMKPARRHRLANWGYAIADASIRRWVQPGERGSFPFEGGVG